MGKTLEEYQSCLWEGAKHQRSGSECGSVAVTDIEREVSSVLLAIDIADLGGRVETGRKNYVFIGRQRRRRNLLFVFVDICLAIVLYKFFHLPVTTL